MNEKLKTLAQNVYINLHEMNEMTLNGDADALETFVHLKKIEKLFKIMMKGTQHLAVEEAFEYGGTFERHGAEIQCKNGTKRYDFSNCASWQEIKDKLTVKEKELKLAFSAYEGGKNMVSDDGEISEIPNVTYSADTIAVKILRES
jgi:hypothetical protein